MPRILTARQRVAARERAETWRENNRERYNELQRESYARRRAAVAAARRDPAARKRKRIYDAAYREKHRAELKVKRRKYYLKRKRELLRASKQWARQNPERVKEHKRGYRARLRGEPYGEAEGRAA